MGSVSKRSKISLSNSKCINLRFSGNELNEVEILSHFVFFLMRIIRGLKQLVLIMAYYNSKPLISNKLMYFDGGYY